MGDRHPRDVGADLRRLGCSIVQPGRLFRSGDGDIWCLDALGTLPRTVIGLRSAPSTGLCEATYLHLPFPSECVKYDGQSEEIRLWIRSVIVRLDSDEVRVPVIVHCAAGVDRTGMLVAAFLRALSVPPHIVAAEYALSEGARPERLQHFMLGLSYNGFIDSLKLRRAERYTS